MTDPVLAGANREGVTPVPIPNTEVKPLIADGTAEFALWESRTVPALKSYILIKKAVLRPLFFCPDSFTSIEIPESQLIRILL